MWGICLPIRVSNHTLKIEKSIGLSGLPDAHSGLMLEHEWTGRFLVRHMTSTLRPEAA